MPSGPRTEAQLAADVGLAEAIYRATAPRSGDDDFDEDPISASSVAIGLLGRARRFLYAIIRLHDADALDAADSLARASLEHAVTGRWLLEDPDTNLPLFLSAAAVHLREMEELRPERFSGFAKALGAIVGDSTGARFPGVKKRMGDLRGMYWMYKMLCETTHPTFVAASIVDTEDAGYSDGSGMAASRGSDYVLFAALWTWILANAIEDAAGESMFSEPLEPFRMELAAAIMYDPVSDTFGPLSETEPR